MYSDWGVQARADIEQVMQSLPADATLDDRRKALKRHAHAFHGGTSWGKKVWPRECRKYLEREHGLPPISMETVSHQSKLFQKASSGDIVFPFRGEKDDGGHLSNR